MSEGDAVGSDKTAIDVIEWNQFWKNGEDKCRKNFRASQGPKCYGSNGRLKEAFDLNEAFDLKGAKLRKSQGMKSQSDVSVRNFPPLLERCLGAEVQVFRRMRVA